MPDNVPGATAQWTLITANPGASINPITNTLCATYNMEWGIVELKLTNRCGSSYYNFYVDNETSGMYSVYPNPAKGELNIEFKNETIAKYLTEDISLYNDQGKIVRSFKTTNQKTNKIKFNINDLSSGTYYLHLKTKNGFEKSQILIE